MRKVRRKKSEERIQKSEKRSDKEKVKGIRKRNKKTKNNYSPVHLSWSAQRIGGQVQKDYKFIVLFFSLDRKETKDQGCKKLVEN